MKYLETFEGLGYQKYKACDTKNKYKSIDDAMIQGKFSMDKQNVQLYTYLCKFCNNWHLTKSITRYKVI